MRNAKIRLACGLVPLTLAACGGRDAENGEQNIAVDQTLPTGQIPPNADIEALPADESSVTPSDELQNGINVPEANEAVSENAQ